MAAPRENQTDEPVWVDLREKVWSAVLLAERFAPYAIALLVFFGGLSLVLSGTGPLEVGRRAYLRDVLPLPFAEASHLSASLSGLALMVLSRGLWLRMVQARNASILILLAGAGFALIKALAWEEAGLLVAIAGALFLARRRFYRIGGWRSYRPSRGFILMILLAVSAITLIGIISFRNIDFRGDMWWSFAWRGDASRFLRASLLVAVAVAALALDVVVNRPRRSLAPNVAVPEAVRRLLASCPDSAMQAVLLGDKQFLIAPDESAFLAYAISGNSWVCLGGPVGDRKSGQALIWQLAELADKAAARPVFYNVRPDGVFSLLDVGHATLKTGETARLDLKAFSLEGATRKDLRYARSRAQRDGLTFSVLPAGSPIPWDQLEEVSTSWLSERHGREKGFSLGRFDRGYLESFDIAVMQYQGRIVAFANLWNGGGVELAVDLMRHLPDQSPVLMDALMTEIMLWAKEQGHDWFSLGGAPLSGLSQHPLAPLWHRIGVLIYRRGDEYYSFEGLRAFKQKFGPVWESRYLTCPGGLSMARALVDVTLLISRPRKR